MGFPRNRIGWPTVRIFGRIPVMLPTHSQFRMSGVQVNNKNLLELGLTLPGFVDRSKVIASLPSLGQLTLAAHTPDNWEVI